jgi:chitodextrinase
VVAAGHPGIQFTDSGLRPGTKHCYAVLALDAAGNRSPAAAACATTLDLAPPTAPGRPAAVSVSSSQLFVGWDPSTDDVGVLGYEVLRDGAVIAKVAVTRMREFKLPANREFCYMVRAFDAAGNRSDLAGPACATTADPSQLTSPSDLRAVRVSTTDVLLQWEPSEQGGVYYRIYENDNKSVGLTRGNTFNPSGRMGARADCYRVAAVDDQGRESRRSNEVCAQLAGMK